MVQFAGADGALAAKAALDGAIFQGRLLHVLPAHRPPPQRRDAAPGAEVPAPNPQTLNRQISTDAVGGWGGRSRCCAARGCRARTSCCADSTRMKAPVKRPCAAEVESWAPYPLEMPSAQGL